MEKNRIILFLALSLAVFYGSRWLLPTVPNKPPEKSETVKPPETGKSPTPPPAPTVSPATGENVSIHGEIPEELVVESPLYIATLSNVGGVLKSFRLKGYPDHDGKPVEMVDKKAIPPLSIDSGDKARDSLIEQAKFRGRKDDLTVVFEWAENGTHVRKEYRFSAVSYTFSIESLVAQNEAAIPHRLLWTGFGDREVNGTGILCWVGMGSCDDPTRHAVVDITPPPTPGQTDVTAKYERVQPGSLKDETETQSAVQERTTRRVGMEDQFFVLMLTLPDPAVFHISRSRVVGENQQATGVIGVSVPTQRGAVQVYAGPRERTALEKADPKLREVVNYGYFWFITEPLAKALMWVHGFLGNFGWAIIALTCGINLALFPLRLKQQMSMQKLQKLQPQMRTLQDKYKKLKAGDPRRAEIQAQIMNLYKEHGVNPVGGCFPLLLQFPFLIAFYNVLSMSIELRHAPWLLWIQDLSQRDPYFIMPFLMAGSMLVMQKMTPTTVDPQQARMMMIMPIIMSVMFLTYPSGLMLYWLTSNLIGIGQQVFIAKFWSPARASVD